MSQVTVTSDHNFRQQIQARQHTLTADEPREVGGDDTGPTPYELILAALGACTSMTVQLYARRRGWPLEAVQVRLFHNRVHARDCEECERKESYLDHIDKQILVFGALTTEQVQRLGDIAAQCPVHRTLGNTVHITQQINLAGEPVGSS